MKQTAMALALVSAGTLGFAHTSHALTLPAPSALKQAVPSQTTQVFWRGGWGAGIGLGIVAGALTAAAVAGGPYWGGGYWGGYPSYGYPGYAYAPAYGYAYAPAYSYGYGPGYAYAPASYSYGPAYSYTYGTGYVRPRIGYAYGRVGTRVGYANTWGSGVRRAYGSGPRYHAASMRTARVAQRRR
jgi:hypothetical protein